VAARLKVPRAVTVFEVGPRDGLQNESREIPFGLKVSFVQGLVRAGLREIELGAFVRPDRVPRMADTDRLFADRRIRALASGRARFWSLVPNARGLERAAAAGARRIAVFTAASETFARKNIGMGIDESLAVFAGVARDARALGIEVRGYVSTVFGCPYEGKVSPRRGLRAVERLSEIGVSQASIGDTIGVATPAGVDAVMRPALRALGARRVAGHFHDTRGTALANALRALELGVTTLDSSAGGLGGCPYAPGATGNLATEDLVYMLEGLGVRTGVDLDELCRVSLDLSRRMGRAVTSRYLQAWASAAKRKR